MKLKIVLSDRNSDGSEKCESRTQERMICAIYFTCMEQGRVEELFVKVTKVLGRDMGIA